MTIDLETLTLNNPTNLWLEIPENQQTKIWEQSQAFSTDNRCWMAYLNRLSLNIFLPWLKEEYVRDAKVFPSSATLPSIWEVTNGTGIVFNGKKLVLIPSEASDISELRVPRMESGVSEAARLFGWASVDLVQGLQGSRGTTAPPQLPRLIKTITISGLEYQLLVKPKGNLDSRVWRFELRRATIGEMIPVGVKLILLTEDLQPFDGNQAQAKTPVERIYVDVALGPDEEALVWKTEPVSDDYDYEALYL